MCVADIRKPGILQEFQKSGHGSEMRRGALRYTQGICIFDRIVFRTAENHRGFEYSQREPLLPGTVLCGRMEQGCMGSNHHIGTRQIHTCNGTPYVFFSDHSPLL